jgi:hypothetical protein
MILEYLSSDLSAANADDVASQVEMTVTNIHRLTDDEETCLLLVLNASLAKFLSEGSDGAPTEKKSLKDDDDRMEIGRLLIKYLPKLLKKYGAEYEGQGLRRLMETVKLVRHLDISVYLELRMLKVGFNVSLCSAET